MSTVTEHGQLLQTVDRAALLLKCFTLTRPTWGVTDLAREMGVAKSMVARLLDTLEAHGFVEQNPESKRYSLGVGLIRLGLIAQETGGGVHRLAVPVMEELTAATGETSLLCVPRQTHSVCTEQISSPHQGLRLAIERGTTSPLYAGASNKALLAFLSEGQIETVIEAGLTAYTELTVTDPAQLRRQLAEIRERGWCASWGELSPDVAAVAAPIFDGSGRLVASLSVGGPVPRFTPDRVEKLAEQVKSAAATLMRRIAGG